MKHLVAFVREPIVAFCIVGGLIFGLNALATERAKERIILTAGQLKDLVAYRQQISGRKLSPLEQKRLIQEFVNQELLIREAVSRGLHLQDARVRSRLAAKMNFLFEKEAPAPSQSDLEKLREARPERYLTPKQVTFEHIYFGNSKSAAEQILPAVVAGKVKPSDVGKIFWLGSKMERYSALGLLSVMGAEFVNKLKTLPKDKWTGPIRSGQGWHLIRLVQFHEPKPLPKDAMDRQLRIDWAKQYRDKTRAEEIARLRDRFVVILPESTGPEGK